jgi:signal transduction histidine kinase
VDAIIGNLLAFARPANVQLTRIDLRKLVEETLGDWLAGRVEAALPAGEAPVQGDATALRQVLENLLRNAVEAGGEEVPIRVGLALRNCSWLLSVEDGGPGIPPELREEIFEPFRSEKEKGTGLGLAIVHRVVELHHGRVRAVAPEEGEGARFEVFLPAEDPHER